MVRTLLFSCLASIASAQDITFAGKDPGVASASVRNQTESGKSILSLVNTAIIATWEVADGKLRPLSVTNQLTGLKIDQTGAELFRLTTQAPAPLPAQIEASVVLEETRVVVVVSKPGSAPVEIATFPRKDFLGEPKLVRCGKMNLKAEAKNNPDGGPVGHCTIELLRPTNIAATGVISLDGPAHHASVREFAFPKGTRVVTARIDKDTDQGMSWGPGLALVWEEGAKFILVGVRNGKGTLNVTTASGEREVTPQLSPYPAGDQLASDFRLVTAPRISRLKPMPKSSRMAEAISGAALEAELVSASGLRVLWRAELRDGSNYFRQTLRLVSPQSLVVLHGVEMNELKLPNAAVIGSVPGSPVAGSGFFTGIEMPGTTQFVDPEGVRQGFACELKIEKDQAYAFGSVVGVAVEGQLRRGFLRYIERERARASQPFLHYNCWYDLGYGVNRQGMLDVVKAFDAELVRKRGVPVKAYLVDDGWDDFSLGLWADNLKRFPKGLTGLAAEMDKVDAHLGIWISPLGGYGGDKERTAHAQRMGLIPPQAKLDLAYPGYRKWFEERCLQLMRSAGVNAFKWDKAGEGVSPHFMALLEVARRLRVENPSLFINVTVGTWPSPFWLNHIDTTWRDGSADVGWVGQGDDREKWLTFRDGYCRKLFVEKSPLYPLNSVMHHGIVHGRAFQGEKVGKAGPDLKNEARSYFANGAMLQELYLTPSMMTAASWDAVAEAAKWAHARADVLRDAHWVGGDPLKLEPYGYAAWAPRQGTLMVRNPSETSKEISLEAGEVFDLPAGVPGVFDLRSPYADQRLKTLTLSRGEAVKVTLQPFEVLVFDAIPRK